MRRSYVSNFQPLNFVLFLCATLSFESLQASEIKWECIAIDDYLTSSICEDKFGRTLTIGEPKELGMNWSVRLTMPGGSVFEGTSSDGIISGTRVDPDNTITSGMIVGKLFHGKSKITYPDGGIYVGYLSEGEREGLGTLTTLDGSITEGEWLDDGIYNGQHIGANDVGNIVTYNGYFDPETGEENGKGQVKWSTGESYKGSFVQGIMEGYGEYIYVGGDVYKGYWLEGKKNGFGIYQHIEPIDGGAYTYDRYEGEFKDDLFSGIGVLFLKSKIIYIGGFQDSFRSGYGIHAAGVTGAWGEDDKTILRGQWNNSQDGNSIEEYADGSSYVGLIKNGIRSGMGKLNFPANRRSKSGYFIDDKLQGLGVETRHSSTIEVNFVDGLKDGEAQITWNDGEQSLAVFNEGEYIWDSLESRKSSMFLSKRLALVIGNDNYASRPLENAVSDSIGIKNALEEAGFQVIHSANLDQQTFLQAIWAFERKLKSMGPSTTALFYYSGHALEVDGINYLNPTDAVIESKFDLETKSINVSRVFSALAAASSGVKIMILDACRTNPFVSFSRSPSQGLAQMNAPTGTIISYSTAPGKLALDGMVDGYSMYTGSLIQSIGLPGLTIEEAFKRTRQSVVKLSDSKQIPWESSSLLGDFYFLKE